MRLRALFAGFIFTLILLSVGTGVLLYITAPKQYTVLFIGSDQRGTERARSDVLFLLSLPKDPARQPFFLSIPRDTKIEDEEYGLQKITHFYALGDRPDDEKVLGNVELTTHTVEELLSVPVDATVEVTFASFEDIINDLGGAALNGATLTGSEALAVVRDRFTGGRSDFDRQADEREILRSLITKLKTKENVELLRDYFADSTQARLKYSKPKLVRFLIGAGIARKGRISIGSMEEASIPGTGGKIYTPDFGKELYYWIPDEVALKTLLGEHFQ